MAPGASFDVRAGNTGSVISYHCTLHSRMKGKIVVDPPHKRFDNSMNDARVLRQCVS
jgi:hypothetical protein